MDSVKMEFDEEESSMDPTPRKRNAKSLGQLTKKFVLMLIENALSGVDLNEACKELGVTQKRRIYDITNVLEGVSLIKKINKNLYQWKGKFDDSDDPSAIKEVNKLLEEQQLLKQEESLLDEALESVLIADNFLKLNESYCYVTRDDLLTALGKRQTIFIAKDFKELEQKSNRVHLKGDIYGYQAIDMRLVDNRGEIKDNFIETTEIESIVSEEEQTEDPLESAFSKITLFKRTLQKKHPVFKMNSKVAEQILTQDINTHKSQFHNVKEQKLINDEDYNNPELIAVTHPVDYDYQYSYSLDPEKEGIHELFDIDIDIQQYDEYVDQYEIEMLDDEHL
ncbi:unnamed protein product [Diamesa hyperborea]